MKRSTLSVFLALVGIVCLSSGVSAQTGTPGPATGCTVEPRSDAEIAELTALAATPVASPEAEQVATLPAGEQADIATVEALLATLIEANACAESGDLPRLLALYSDEFIVRSFFTDEPEAILPGQPPVDFSKPATTTAIDLRPAILEARVLPDGRAAALVAPNRETETRDVVWFVQEGDRWLIDEIQPAESETGTPVAIPADAQAIVDAVIANASTMLQDSPDDLAVTFIESIEWPDSALGCPEEGGVYAQVITPGYLIVISDGKTTLEYHSDLEGNVVECPVGERT
jgi:hypothetical protein